MNLSNLITRPLLIIAILLGFAAAFLFPAGVYAAKEISAGKKKLMVSELLRLSGLAQSQKMAQKEVPPEIFKDSSFLGALDMQPEEKALINNLYQKGFQESVFYRGKFNYILGHFNGEHIKSVMKSFPSRSPEVGLTPRGLSSSLTRRGPDAQGQADAMYQS